MSFSPRHCGKVSDSILFKRSQNSAYISIIRLPKVFSGWSTSLQIFTHMPTSTLTLPWGRWTHFSPLLIHQKVLHIQIDLLYPIFIALDPSSSLYPYFRNHSQPIILNYTIPSTSSSIKSTMRKSPLRCHTMVGRISQRTRLTRGKS